MLRDLASVVSDCLLCLGRLCQPPVEYIASSFLAIVYLLEEVLEADVVGVWHAVVFITVRIVFLIIQVDTLFEVVHHSCFHDVDGRWCNPRVCYSIGSRKVFDGK